MYALVGYYHDTGIYYGYTPSTATEGYIVALFTTKKKALQYIKKATLKRPRTESGCVYPFKKSSVLANYHDAEIEPYTYEEYPTDPTI